MEENITELRKLQLEMLEMMKFFDKFCRDHDIKYSLGYGTLLGAIRHKGFIPWDDDVDFIIDRENYDKLMPLLKQSNLGHYELNHGMTWVPKIIRKEKIEDYSQKVWVDILVYDYIPSNKFIAKLKKIVLLLKQCALIPGVGKQHLLIIRMYVHLSKWIGRMFSLDRKLKWYDNVSRWGNNHVSNYITSYYGLFYNYRHEIHKGNLFDKYVDVEFEHYKFMSIANWDEYLTVAYGDYMTPPPIEKRVSHIMR